MPPRYSVSISPLSLMFVSADGYSSLMGSAQAFVRLDDRMAIDGRDSEHFDDYYGSLYLMMKIGYEFGRKAPMSEIRAKK